MGGGALRVLGGRCSMPSKRHRHACGGPPALLAGMLIADASASTQQAKSAGRPHLDLPRRRDQQVCRLQVPVVHRPAVQVQHACRGRESGAGWCIAHDKLAQGVIFPAHTQSAHRASRRVHTQTTSLACISSTCASIRTHPWRHPGPCPAGVASSAAWQPAHGSRGRRRGEGCRTLAGLLVVRRKRGLGRSAAATLLQAGKQPPTCLLPDA